MQVSFMIIVDSLSVNVKFCAIHIQRIGVNSKNLVKHLVEVKFIQSQLSLHEFFIITFIKFASHTIIITKYFAKITNFAFALCKNFPRNSTGNDGVFTCLVISVQSFVLHCTL